MFDGYQNPNTSFFACKKRSDHKKSQVEVF
jgi:hypothetical protein